MALNQYMHPRNLYRTKKANFQHLAIKYPEFRKHVFPDVSGKLFLDFKNPESLRQLSSTLLKDDFGLDVELPPDRLVPTIPLRLNYILWIEDILKGSGVTEDVKGIDIGTGGSCVYPLLSCRLLNWKFLATEVDDLNHKYAVKNVHKNNMDNLITVKKVDESVLLQDILKDNPETYNFSMCNPPFFTDHLEAQGITSSRSDDRPEPNSVNTASFTESIAFGGEVGFVKRLIHESLDLKDRVRVFTSMVGKKSSLTPLKEELKKLKITNFSTTEFCQGKTMRWGIGWSFDNGIKFPKSVFKEKKKKKRAPLTYIVPEDVPNIMYTIEGVAYRVKEYFKELKIKCEEKSSNDSKISLVITAYDNTWSHQRRKRRQIKNEKNLIKNSENSVNEKKFCPTSSEQKDVNEIFTNNNFDQEERISSKTKKRKYDIEADEASQSKVLKIDDLYPNADHNGEEKCLESCDENIAVDSDASQINITETKSKENSSECAASQIDITEIKSKGNFSECDEEQFGNVNVQSKTEVHEREESKDTYLLKCVVNIKLIEEDQVIIEMSWIDGKICETMNQILQFLKNKLKSYS